MSVSTEGPCYINLWRARRHLLKETDTAESHHENPCSRQDGGRMTSPPPHPPTESDLRGTRRAGQIGWFLEGGGVEKDYKDKP